MNDLTKALTPRYALEILEWALDDRSDDELVEQSIATLSSALIERRLFDKRCDELWDALCQARERRDTLQIACQVLTTGLRVLRSLNLRS